MSLHRTNVATINDLRRLDLLYLVGISRKRRSNWCYRNRLALDHTLPAAPEPVSKITDKLDRKLLFLPIKRRSPAF